MDLWFVFVWIRQQSSCTLLGIILWTHKLAHCAFYRVSRVCMHQKCVDDNPSLMSLDAYPESQVSRMAAGERVHSNYTLHARAHTLGSTSLVEYDRSAD